MTKGVFVGLDYGRKRIGIAVSTPLNTVHPRRRLVRTDPAADLAALCGIAAEADAEAFVLGLPHNMDGTVSGMEKEVRAFAAKLAAASGLAVFGTDERLSTEAAATILRSQDVHGRAQKARRDSTAACLVLSDFLEIEKREQIA